MSTGLEYICQIFNIFKYNSYLLKYDFIKLKKNGKSFMPILSESLNYRNTVDFVYNAFLILNSIFEINGIFLI